MGPESRQYEELIRRKLSMLSNDESNSAEVRNRLYEEIRTAYLQIHSGDAEKLASDIVDLNRTIDQIERELLPRPNWLEVQLLHLKPKIVSAKAVVDQLKVRYGFLAVIITATADLLKPIFEFTIPIMLVSALLSVLCASAAPFLRPIARTLRGISIVSALFFFCSFGWWSAQRLVPGAQAKGALTESFPGFSKFQDGILAALAAIQSDTKRVGNLVEESVRTEQQRTQEKERTERLRIEELKRKVASAGYSLDSIGFASAILDNEDYLPIFRTLNIALTEEALRNRLHEIWVTQLDAVTKTLKSIVIDYPFVRSILHDLAEFEVRMDPDELSEYTLTSAKGRAAACDRRTYMMRVNLTRLREACSQQDAQRFYGYYETFLKYPAE
ncbi:hypothetical protein OOZ54_13845 [Rhodopseudomonas palustris]|uniref:hypothetical protein n=1 Tax=Rhodopseudomonas palustris TaxID=1076 RepID=UPI0022F0D126|nr:hypothetical protein [Rhodopseudomonas palustris]WBU27747.1 hypothetical protein OOZ54_13845 [Rhodopseudomonas palustris]